MKVAAILLLLLCSCTTWEKLPDGREYRFEYNCIESHVELTIMPFVVNGPNNTLTITNQINTKTVCDKYLRSDTIFKNESNSNFLRLSPSRVR